MNDLSRLLDPTTIAIVGLSSDLTKHGGRVLENLQRHRFAGNLWGVNPRMPPIDGVDVYRRVADLPSAPDLVVAAVPASAAVEVVSGCRGVGGVIALGSGFAESGEVGAQLQDELVRTARDVGTRLIGPNSGGIIRPSRSLAASFLTCLDRPANELRSGPVGVVTQSGGTGSYLHNLAAGRGEGLAISISTGNEADVKFAEALDAVSRLHEVKVVIAIIESIRDGQAFVHAVQDARGRSRRVVACWIGRSERGRDLASTHTGAMAGSHLLVRGVLDSLGVGVAETPGEAYEVATMLAGQPEVVGSRMGIVTHSGGMAVLLSDLSESIGVDLPLPSEALTKRLLEHVDQGTVSNPLDMGAIIGGQNRFADAVSTMATSGEYDAILAVSTPHPPAHTSSRVDSLLALRTSVPVIHLWLAGDVSSHGLDRLRQAGAPVTEEPRAAIRALSSLIAHPPLRRGVDPVPRGPSFDWGLPIDSGVPAATVEDAVTAAEEIGYPVVVKIDVPGLEHKTEIEGVKLDLRTAGEVRASFEAVVASALENDHSEVVGVRVQRFRPGLELIVGALRDTSFGPVVSLGTGGVFAELIEGGVFSPAPLGIDDAMKLIDRLSIRALLDGYRGAPAADIEELARIVSVVSHAVVGRGGPSQVEINPLIWDGSEWFGADWLAIENGVAR